MNNNDPPQDKKISDNESINTDNDKLIDLPTSPPQNDVPNELDNGNITFDEPIVVNNSNLGDRMTLDTNNIVNINNTTKKITDGDNFEILQVVCDSVRNQCFIINGAIANHEISSDKFYVEMMAYAILKRYYDTLVQLLEPLYFSSADNLSYRLNEFIDKHLAKQHEAKAISIPDFDEKLIRGVLPTLFKYNASKKQAESSHLPPPKDIGLTDLDYATLSQLCEELTKVRTNYNGSMPHDVRKYNLAFANHEKKPVMCADICGLIWLELITKHVNLIESIHSCSTDNHTFLHVTLKNQQQFFIDGWYGVVLAANTINAPYNQAQYPDLCGHVIKGHKVPLHNFRTCREFFSDTYEEHPMTIQTASITFTTAAYIKVLGQASIENFLRSALVILT